MHHSTIIAIPLWQAATAAGLIGALVGSFVGAALVRLPEGRSVLRGRSACDCCGARLGWAELVPLVSFAVQRGKCRRCGAAIDPWQFAAEAGGALVGIVAALSTGEGWAMLWGALLGWQLLLLGLLDLRHFWLPDRLTALLAATGLAHGLWLWGDRFELLSETLLGGALGFSGLWLVALAYRRLRGREGLGAGDAKLLGAIGLWVGPVGVVTTLLGGSLIALAGAVALLVAGRNVAMQTALPLGSALALAGWVVALLSGL